MNLLWGPFVIGPSNRYPFGFRPSGLGLETFKYPPGHPETHDAGTNASVNPRGGQQRSQIKIFTANQASEAPSLGCAGSSQGPFWDHSCEARAVLPPAGIHGGASTGIVRFRVARGIVERLESGSARYRNDFTRH